MRRVVLLTTMLLAHGQNANACSVPVFRYALERWAPSKYDLVIFHRGELTKDDQEIVRRIEKSSKSANATITTVDLASPVPVKFQSLWKRKNSDQLPYVILQYPDASDEIEPVWTGKLSQLPKDLFDSPARLAMYKHLAAGKAGTIVLLLSGDAKADAAARDFLKINVPKLVARIELPKPTKDGPQIQSKLPMLVEFPMVELDRSGDDQALVQTLLGSEDGLKEVKGPIAFPVFGRGRALCALKGRDLEKIGELQRALEFICKACSCQAKELNPGLDLLMSGNWDGIFGDEPLSPEPKSQRPKAKRRPPIVRSLFPANG